MLYCGHPRPSDLNAAPPIPFFHFALKEIVKAPTGCNLQPVRAFGHASEVFGSFLSRAIHWIPNKMMNAMAPIVSERPSG